VIGSKYTQLIWREILPLSTMSFGDVAPAPRVNKACLNGYVGRTVSLVGAVESYSPTAVVLRTSVKCLLLLIFISSNILITGWRYCQRQTNSRQ
jgi:hypothetical protein